MPRTSGNARHPLKLRLSYRQRSIINQALLLYELHYRGERFYEDGDKNEIADLKMATSRLTCQPGGCDYCTDDGPEITYGRED